MLKINNLSKVYENGKGLQEMSYECNPGEIIALIGENGAGKTTTMNMLGGIVRAQTGEVLLNGRNCCEDSAKKEIGYASDNFLASGKMTIYEILQLVNDIKYDGKYVQEIEELLEEFNLAEKRNLLINQCSTGIKKKVGIIIALLGTPSLIILDEPTNALDTKGILVLKKYINYAAEKGSIIWVSSHILDFVDRVCTKCIFLKEGKVIRVIEKAPDVNLESIYEQLYLGDRMAK